MYALVTGASSGIGLRYATQLAQNYHYDLLLVSNQEQELQNVAMDLAQKYGVQTHALYMNLAEDDSADRILEYAENNGIEVEVLVNNAGILVFSQLCQTPIKKIETLLMLHVLTLTKLCKLFGDKMVARRHGYILNMSSMTAWMAMPGIQCYNATKSYVLNFSKALWYEMQNAGVHVLAITPGSTNTGLLPFPEKYARLLRATGITMEPEKLVKKALDKLFHSKRKQYMPGAWNHIIVPIINHLPDWLVFAIMKKFDVFDLK